MAHETVSLESAIDWGVVSRPLPGEDVCGDLHLVKAAQDRRYLIGNNRGGVNGWVGRSAIFGVATRVERAR